MKNDFSSKEDESFQKYEKKFKKLAKKVKKYKITSQQENINTLIDFINKKVDYCRIIFGIKSKIIFDLKMLIADYLKQLGILLLNQSNPLQ